MAVNHQFQGLLERWLVERTLQVDSEAFVIRAGLFIAELCGEPNLQLRFRERNFGYDERNRRHRRNRESRSGDRIRRGNRDRRGEFFRRDRSQTQTRSRQQAAQLHFRNAVAEGGYHLLQIFFRMRRGQKAGKTFLEVNALLADVIVKQAGQPLVNREAEVENRAEIFYVGGHRVGCKQFIQATYQTPSFFAQLFLQARPALL